MYFLFCFLLVALVLIVRSNLDRREWDWYLRGVRVPSIVRRQFATIGIFLSLLALAFAWGVPSNDLQERLNAFQRFLASDPIQQMAEVWNRLFAPIEGEGSATPTITALICSISAVPSAWVMMSYLRSMRRPRPIDITGVRAFLSVIPMASGRHRLTCG